MAEICGFGEVAELLAKVAVYEEACMRIMHDSEDWQSYHAERAALAWRLFAAVTYGEAAPIHRKPAALRDLDAILIERRSL